MIRAKCLVLILVIFFINISNSFSFCLDLQSEYEYVKGVNNLLLVGVDESHQNDYTFIIILTIDSINNNLKMSIVDKDSYPYIYNLANYDTLISSLNENFNIYVHDYVVINKEALAKIVDSLQIVEIYNKNYSGYELISYIDTLDIKPTETKQYIYLYIIQELLYAFSKTSFSRYPQIIVDTFSYVNINITPYRMLSLGFTALSLNNYTAIQYDLKEK